MQINKYSEFILNETLKTHDIDITLSNVNKELSLMRIYNFEILKHENNTFSIKLNNFTYIFNIKTYIDYINSLIIDRHGWFPSIMNVKYLSGVIKNFPYDEDFLINTVQYLDSVEITYEAKYDLNINDIPKKLYHLSIQEYENDILKKGLIPKSKSKLSKHLDRIYLTSNLSDCYNLINKMTLFYKIKITPKNKINFKWIIFEIDNDDLNINFYKDPNSNGYYIIDNISPKNIKIIDKEK